uniref:Uncharacterized protein n=1 Tax=Anguilla anguilla TaxID=7936 RepID=A0A0E9Q6Y9_ANGAN
MFYSAKLVKYIITIFLYALFFIHPLCLAVLIWSLFSNQN